MDNSFIRKARKEIHSAANLDRSSLDPYEEGPENPDTVYYVKDGRIVSANITGKMTVNIEPVHMTSRHSVFSKIVSVLTRTEVGYARMSPNEDEVYYLMSTGDVLEVDCFFSTPEEAIAEYSEDALAMHREHAKYFF